MITILDGGIGRKLEQRGAPFRQPEWSADCGGIGALHIKEYQSRLQY